MIKKIDMVYSPGTAEYLEDGKFDYLPFFGVIDGCSAPYWDGNPPILFDGFTGGQMARNVILETFRSALPKLSLENLAKEANREIGEMQELKNISLAQTEHLVSTSFVLGKIEQSMIKILQGDDCCVLWTTKSGKINITENKAYKPEVLLVENFARLMKKFNGDRTKAWKEHGPYLGKMRKENANKLYADLNGQPKVEKCWKKIEIPISDLELLICFTDGLVPFNEMANEKKLAEKIICHFINGGLDAILSWTRTIEKIKAEYSHEDHAEATGLAIKFK